MNAPIYNQAIHNGGDRGDEKGRGADATWLRALNDLEHDGDAPPAWVAQAAAPALAPKALTLIQTQVDALDGDDDDGGPSWLFHRSLVAHARSAGRDQQTEVAVTE